MSTPTEFEELKNKMETLENLIVELNLGLTNVANNIKKDMIASEQSTMEFVAGESLSVSKWVTENTKLINKTSTETVKEAMREAKAQDQTTWNLIGTLVKQLDELHTYTKSAMVEMRKTQEEVNIGMMKEQLASQELLVKMIDKMVLIDAKLENVINPKSLNS